MADTERLTVYYDGACPLCRREIAFYERLDRAGQVAWCDVGSVEADGLAAGGLTRETALRRLHVRRPDGTLVSGAAAFVEIWKRLPRFGWLARLARLPGMPWVMEGTYDGFLRVRPWLTGRRGVAD